MEWALNQKSKELRRAQRSSGLWSSSSCRWCAHTASPRSHPGVQHLSILGGSCHLCLALTFACFPLAINPVVLATWLYLHFWSQRVFAFWTSLAIFNSGGHVVSVLIRPGEPFSVFEFFFYL